MLNVGRFTPLSGRRASREVISQSVQISVKDGVCSDRAERRRYAIIFAVGALGCAAGSWELITRVGSWYSTLAGILMGWLALSAGFLVLWILAARPPSTHDEG
jgi:hypothetical protein